jgi:hypothetical protein
MILRSGVMVNGVIQLTEEGTVQGSLCKALHNPPYAKLTIMQSKSLKLADFQDLQLIYFA